MLVTKLARDLVADTYEGLVQNDVQEVGRVRSYRHTVHEPAVEANIKLEYNHRTGRWVVVPQVFGRI